MNKIVKQEITVVENKEGAVFKVGDVIIKEVTNRSRSTNFTTPSTILSFKVSKRKDANIVHAITDFKHNNGIINKNGISIDKISLYINTFPRCFKIKSLGYDNEIDNRIFTSKINKIIGYDKFYGRSGINSFYYLNLDNLRETDCSAHNLNPKFQEVTVEQFLKYCEDEKI